MKSPMIVFVFALVILLASACASTQTITEPVLVIEAFYEAVNDGDLDGAMSFVADDARLISDTLYTGQAGFRDYHQMRQSRNTYYELSDLRQDGDKVFFTLTETYDTGRYLVKGEAVVREGMIVSLIVP